MPSQKPPPPEEAVLIEEGVGATIGGKGTYGFVVRYEAGERAPTGNLVYHDHEADVDIKAIRFDTLVIGRCTATIMGEAEVNGVRETLKVDVVDGGEPGSEPDPGPDTFLIKTDSYTAAGPLVGGDNQIHDEDC